MSATATQNTITLKGSTKIVAEFFDYAINSILYQRGIYPADEFEQVKKYNMSLMVTKDGGLREYLNTVLGQISAWLMTGDVKKLVVVISDQKTSDPKERWNFDIQTDLDAAKAGVEKSIKEIHGEIATIIRQITMSVSYLPLLPDCCTFDLLVYTGQDTMVPTKWEESAPKYIANSEQVRLYSFSTKVHKVDSMVSYAVEAQ